MENIPKDKYEPPKEFVAKKLKYEKKEFLWTKYPQLVAKDKLFYTKEDKELIKKLLYNPFPNDEYRKEFWFISSGAKLEYINNPGYYKKLVDLIPKFFPYYPDSPESCGDIKRLSKTVTFFQEKENSDKLANILKAFAIRNSPSLGYTQAYHFIAAILYLEMRDEEKAFWILTKILEDFLPFDLYLDAKGIWFYRKMTQLLINEKVKKFENKEDLLEDLTMIYDVLGPALYANKTDHEVVKNIWDCFFIYGDIIIFKAFNFFASVLLDKTYNNNLFKPIVNVQPSDRLINIKQNDLLKYYLLMDETINESYLNEITKEAKINFDEFFKGVHHIKEISEGTKCDPSTPYCFYNKIINDVEHFSEYRILKLKKNTEKNDNYFSDLFNSDKFDENKLTDIKNETKGDNFDDILIERIEHICSKENQVENK